MASNKDLKQASFFDLDHTLLTVNSSYHFGKYLFKNKVIGKFQIIPLVFIYFLHKSRLLSLQSLHVATFKRLFFKKSYRLFERHMHAFLDENLEHLIYQPAFQRLRKAQEEGHYVAVLSSSPSFLVKEICQRLKILSFLGSHYAIDEKGDFASIQELVQGNTKAEWVKNFSLKNSLLECNIAIYSDSYLDRDFFNSGGVKIGVNPDSKLRALCYKNRWEII